MSCLCCCILAASCFISWPFTLYACLSVIRTCCRAIKCRKFAGSRMGNTRTYCMYHVDFQQFYCVVISAFTLYWKFIKSNPLYLHCWRFGVYQRPKRQQCKNNGLFWWIFTMKGSPTNRIGLLPVFTQIIERSTLLQLWSQSFSVVFFVKCSLCLTGFYLCVTFTKVLTIRSLVN